MREVSFLHKFLSVFACTVVIIVLGTGLIAGLVSLVILITSINIPFWLLITPIILGISFLGALLCTGIVEAAISEKEKLND